MERGWYKVTLRQYNRQTNTCPEFFEDWLYWDNGWDLEGYEGNSTVHEILMYKEEEKENA